MLKTRFATLICTAAFMAGTLAIAASANAGEGSWSAGKGIKCTVVAVSQTGGLVIVCK